MKNKKKCLIGLFEDLRDDDINPKIKQGDIKKSSKV